MAVDAFWMLSEPIITDEIEIEEVERRLAGAQAVLPRVGLLHRGTKRRSHSQSGHWPTAESVGCS